MKPKWMRLNTSCPDCGLIVDEGFAELNGKLVNCMAGVGGCFDCPRCLAHYTNAEFWELNHDKNAHVYAKHSGASTLKEDASS